MTKLNAVLFDLDGTLLDTAPDFYRILRQQMLEHRLPVPDYELIRTRASDGAGVMLDTALQSLCVELDRNQLLEQFLQRYASDPVSSGGLFSGIEALLDWCETQQIAWGVVTNKPRHLSEIVLQRLQISERCSVLICPEDVAEAKPSPEGLLLAATRLNAPADRCVYLGDHLRDIEAGRRAQMSTVACGYGYLSENESISDWRADHQVSHSTELLPLIQSLHGN